MTFRNVYIGDLADGPDPFDWGGDWNIGNCPPVKSPHFPHPGGGMTGEHRHSLVIVGIRDGRFEGQHVDWGASVAKVSKAEILKFIAEVYGDEDANRSLLPHQYVIYQQLMEFVRNLSATAHYALVANEF